MAAVAQAAAEAECPVVAGALEGECPAAAAEPGNDKVAAEEPAAKAAVVASAAPAAGQRKAVRDNVLKEETKASTAKAAHKARDSKHNRRSSEIAPRTTCRAINKETNSSNRRWLGPIRRTSRVEAETTVTATAAGASIARRLTVLDTPELLMPGRPTERIHTVPHLMAAADRSMST